MPDAKGPDVTKPPSRFAEWIKGETPSKIAESLGVAEWTVRGWQHKAEGKPRGSRPRSELMAEIIKLSRGQLVAADIYPPRPKRVKK